MRLAELVSTENGFSYKHGAPSGALAGFLPLKTAKTPNLTPSQPFGNISLLRLEK